MTRPDDGPRVAVIGGGLAGMAAATALGTAGCRVTLFESRAALGGRATSYTDAATGEVIDNCQHVAMGCCTNFIKFCELLGLRDEFETCRELTFVSGTGTQTRFADDSRPAPVHLSAAFFRLPWLTAVERLRFAWAVARLAWTQPDQLRSVNFEQWLRDRGQSENLIRNVWELVLVSALSESLDRIDAAYARKVFVDGFLTSREGWRLLIPRRPLGELFHGIGTQRLAELGVTVRVKAAPGRLVIDGDTLQLPESPHDSSERFDDAVIAVPWHQLDSVLPDDDRLGALRSNAGKLESAPITSVHLWYDRAITPLPHAVLVGRVSQWLFARSRSADGAGEMYQVVISNSRDLKGKSPGEIAELVAGELGEAFPEARRARLIRARALTERRAVYSAVPGVDAFRPPQQTPVECLQLAGDWTQTGWPSTMEGAVKSGFLAAENILRRHGRSESFSQAPLPASWLSRLLGLC